MHRLSITFILLCLLASCRQAEDSFSNEGETRRDSLALHVAIYPTLETLPLYYAEQSGVLKEGKTDIKLIHYESMMDCDTALLHGFVQISFTDVARIATMNMKEGASIKPVASTPVYTALFSPNSKKINRIQQLTEKLVGLERYSQSEYWSQKILSETDVDTLDIFRIQIGSTHLRYDMLSNGLLDAAFLCEPYASLMKDSMIAQCIWEQPDSTTTWRTIATMSNTKKDKRISKQIQSLLEIYEKARVQVSEHCDTAMLHKIYRNYYHIKERDLQRTHWYEWKVSPLDTTSCTKTMQQAEHWLYAE